MICDYRKTPQQLNQRQLNTCLRKSVDKNCSLNLDFKIQNQSSVEEKTTSKMSTITAAVAATGVNKKPLVKTPMESVVVNSIIYSKPSFCGISVDLGEVPVGKKSSAKAKLANGLCQSSNVACLSETICSCSMDLRNPSQNFDTASRFGGLAKTSSLNVGEDAELYRMCTTLNGTINHQISGLCDNILAMAGLYNVTAKERKDDSFVEFTYKDDEYEDDDDDDTDDDDDDDTDDDDDDTDADDDDDDEYDYYDEDDDDVVDFSYDCPIEPVPKLSCDTKKKVRFNTIPTVHNMHTWNYAYRAARKGEWEMYARDRERFKLRIQRTALILNPILEREHRQKIYEKRFVHLFNSDDGQTKDSIEIMQLKKNSTNNESKNPHQKKKRKKKRYCKTGNKHYF